jgi:hypothetical protein
VKLLFGTTDGSTEENLEKHAIRIADSILNMSTNSSFSSPRVELGNPFHSQTSSHLTFFVLVFLDHVFLSVGSCLRAISDDILYRCSVLMKKSCNLNPR